MSFSIRYQIIPALPKLAWLADVDRQSRVVTVLCGSSVERRDSFFAVGAWSGDFADADFDKTEVFCGSGAKLTKDGIDFVTPSHASERLLLKDNGEHVAVSNSLPFILEYSKAELDRGIDSYESILCSMLKGPEKIMDIPLAGSETLKQYIVGIISVTDSSIGYQRRPAIKPFDTYEDYYSRLLGAVKATKENFFSPERDHPGSGIVSTISAGYDSTACSALAKKIGCDRVVSLSGGQYEIDDGAKVARELGYDDIVKRDYRGYKTKKDCIDAEYVSSGELGSEMQFCVFEDLFADSLVFVGSRGSYWNKSFEMTDDFEMIGYYYFETNSSYIENALRNGAVFFPVPAYGGAVCSSIKRISNSEDMRPWSLGGSYDKPIPRRIAETAGCSRESFGTVKYGGGFSFCYDNKKRVGKKMTEEGYASFISFEKNKGGVANSPKRFFHRLRYLRKMTPIYINVAAKKAHIPVKIRQKPLDISNPGAPADLIFWGTAIMKERYRKALAQV